MSNLFSNLINKIKTKKLPNSLETLDEYAFSLEEIDNLREENAKKIKDLKEDKLGLKKDEDLLVAHEIVDEIVDISDNLEVINTDDSNDLDVVAEEFDDEIGEISISSLLEKKKNNLKNEKISEENEEQTSEIKDDEEEVKSFINLSSKNQDLVMKYWQDINNNDIDKDIINGKEILNHNYNINYGENASKFVHDIRKKYEVVICYLIGFNNEKNGIMDKTIFSDKVDNEWKYLENYVKILEKIRTFKK